MFKKSQKRKSPKRKSPKRKSPKRKSPKRKSPKRKSPKRKSHKRKSPKIKSKSGECSKSYKSKYLRRPGPSYPAQDCKNRTLQGNDKLLYKSKPDKNGIYKWIKI